MDFLKDTKNDGVVLEVREQRNANKSYFYPENEPARMLLALMQRKTFVAADIPRIKEFAKACGFEIEMNVLSVRKNLL